jgi:formylglycine-generating enzyme required for sulfatase activity
MSKNSAARRKPGTTTHATTGTPSRKEWSGWKWIVILVLGAGIGYGATLAYPTVRGWVARMQPPAPAPEPEPAFDPLAHAATTPASMVRIPGGTFRMGTNDQHPHFSNANPEHEVEVGAFWLDETEVTNAQFAAFVKATGYVTVAEQKPTLESIRAGLPPEAPDPPPEMMVPLSLVFVQPDGPVPNNSSYWWKVVPGASWKHPEGPGSDLKDRMNHPVVHVCWKDAEAYAKWTGKRLPTEAEWEFAARGGLVGKVYAWGDEAPSEGGKWRCNIWQGRFPYENTLADGHLRTAPVKSYPPNAYGLYDMAGNVWEWCGDWYRPDYYLNSPRRNPTGPESSLDPQEPNPTMPKRVQRGGSFLCSDGFCSRYKPYGRGRGDIDTGQSHVGFRCATDAR